MPELNHDHHDGVAFETVGEELRARTDGYRHASWDGATPAERPRVGPLIVTSTNQHPSSGTLPAWLELGDLYIYTGSATPVLHLPGNDPAPLTLAQAYALLVPSDAETTYFVDFAAGSDGAAGTSRETAFATLDHAIETAVAGDVIKILNGTWASGTGLRTFAGDGGSAGNPIEVWAESLHGAVLHVTGAGDAWWCQTEYLSINGLHLTGADSFGLDCDANATGTSVRFCKVSGILGVGASGQLLGLRAGGHLAEHNTLIGNAPAAGDAATTGNHGINAAGANNTIRNNLIVAIRGGAGIHLYSGTPANQDGTVIVHNTITNASRAGILVEGTNLLVANNLIAHVGDGGGGNGYGISVNAGSSGTVTTNLLHDTEGSAYLDATGSLPHQNPILADPAFVDYQPDGSGDYRPQAGSPAVGAADPAHAPARDHDYRERDANPDVGAFERGA